MEKEYVEMKVDIVDFVENEMVELDVVQIGQIEVDGGDGSDCDDVECGDKGRDGDAKETRAAGYLPTTPLPSLNLLPNQSKPIAPTPSLSLP